jgi:hypothetical protein
LREIIVLSMKTWLPEETLKGLREAEAFRREQVRVHFRLLEHARPGALTVLSSKERSIGQPVGQRPAQTASAFASSTHVAFEPPS